MMLLIYSLFIIAGILYVISKYYEIKGNRQKAKKRLNESYKYLKKSWNDLKRQFE